MSSTHLHKAKQLGLSENQQEVLFPIACWYNGINVSPADRKLNIAYDQEPQLEELLRGVGIEYQHRETHQKMLDQGLLREGYICGNKVDWLLTENGHKSLTHIFGTDDRIANSLYPDESGFICDDTELLRHRKGVIAAWYRLLHSKFVDNDSLYPYPTIYEDGANSDVGAGLDRYNDTCGLVEMINETNERDTWRKKWTTFCEMPCWTFWIFPNRSTMCKFFNYLHAEDLPEASRLKLINGPFSKDYSNWAPPRVNQRLKRSRSADLVGPNNFSIAWTLGSLITQGNNFIIRKADEYKPSYY